MVRYPIRGAALVIVGFPVLQANLYKFRLFASLSLQVNILPRLLPHFGRRGTACLFDCFGYLRTVTKSGGGYKSRILTKSGEGISSVYLRKVVSA